MLTIDRITGIARSLSLIISTLIIIMRRIIQTVAVTLLVGYIAPALLGLQSQAWALTVSGTVYTNEGVTNAGSGLEVVIISGGANVGSAITNASGVFSITATLAAGTPYLLYVNSGSLDATTASLSSGANMTGVDLYSDHVIVRSDNGGSLTNANMNTALGAYSDNEILYTVSGGALTVTPVSELYVAGGHSFTPGGNVMTESMESKGTFVGGNYTLTITTNMVISGGSFTAPSASGSFTVGQDFTVSAGTYTHNSGTVTFNTDGGNLSTINTGSAVFNNVNIVKVNNDIDVTGTMNIGGNLTLTSADNLGGGTYAVGGNISTADVGILGTSAITLNGTGSQTITSSGGGVFPGGTFTVNKTSGTATLASNLTLNSAGQDMILTAGTLDLSSYNLSVADLLRVNAAGTLRLIGSETITYGVGTLDAGSTVVYYGTAGPYTVHNASYQNLIFDGTGGVFKLGAAGNVNQNLTINAGTLDIAGYNYVVVGTFSNNDTFKLIGSESISGTPDVDSGTVLYYGSGSYAALAMGNACYNVTFNGSGSWTHTGALDVNGNLTITSGTLNSGVQNINVAGNWSKSGTYTSGANTVTLDGTNQTISGNTTFNNLTKSVATARTLTFAAGSTTTINGTATLNGAAGQLLSLRSGTPGTRWNFNLGASATKAISYINVQDSDASGSAAAKKPIAPTNSTDNGNNLDWYNITVSGTAYSDEGVTNVGSGKTIRLIVNGASVGTSSTNASGAYSISASINPGDAMLVYIDGDATYDATTVTVSNGVALAGFNLYANHLIVRHDNAGSLTNALMNTAKGAYVDTEILYSIAAGNLTVSGASTELFIFSGHSFAPGGNVTTPNMESKGTFNGGSGNIDSNDALVISGGTFTATSGTTNIAGNYTLSAGTFTHNNGTVTFDGTSGTKLITPGGQSFYNITFNDAASTATYQLQGALTVANDLTVTDGILDTKAGSSFAINVTRDFIQSGGRVLAQSSTVTVGRDFTANGTELSTGFNSASLVLTGAGGLTYNSLASDWSNGFNNLTVAQSGNTTTLNNTIAVLGTLAVGSGIFTSPGAQAVYLRKSPGSPFDFTSVTAATRISVGFLKMYGTGNQSLPALPNSRGYDSTIAIATSGNTVTQTAAVIIVAPKGLDIVGDGSASRIQTYSTGGFALDVGGNITLGWGGDTGAKTLNVTNSTVTVGGNIEIRSGTTTFTSTSSTVILNGAAAQTVLMSGENFNNLTITNASVAGVSFLDAFNAANITDTTAGSKLTFKNGATYAISGTLTLTGASGNAVTLLSDSAGFRFTLDVTGGAQTVNYVNVKDSQASTNDISAIGSINSGNNDDAEAPSAQWIFDSCPQVTSTADSGAGTLRACIIYANNNAGADTLTFNIAGCPGGLCTITPAGVLPALSDATGGTTINGYTQSGAVANTVASPGASNAVLKIQLSGGGANFAGLTMSSANNIVKGLVINGFSGVGAGAGITITGAAATGNTVSGNYLGTNAAGTAAAANYFGANITSSAQSNTAGGTDPADRNVLSGNTSSGISISGAATSANIVKGNYIGTDVNGTVAIGNGYDGVGIYAPSNIIGGPTAAERNIISGNAGEGMTLGGAFATSNVIKGNFIGVDVNSASLPNVQNGIRFNVNANSNTVGGTAAGEGNTIANNGVNGILVGSTGLQLLGNTIYGNSQEGIKSSKTGTIISKNLVRNNGGATYNGIALNAGATNNKIYNNTIHANGASGIYVNETGAIIKNNNITGNGAYGINLIAASMTESYNDITDAATTPANASGRSNVALDSTDLNANPLYVNAAGGDFTLTECTSTTINAGVDLGGDQPDMNGGSAGLYNNNAPETGAFETSSACVPIFDIVKQMWEEDGLAPLASPSSIAKGATVVFLIYVKNTSAGNVADVRINDSLDEAGFQYIDGSFFRTSAATPPADTATDKQIFDATASGTGTSLTEAVDGDVGSSVDTGGGADKDRITVGAVTGQVNAALSIPAHKAFAIRFKVKVK